MVPNICTKTHEDLIMEVTPKQGLLDLCERKILGKVSHTKTFRISLGKLRQKSFASPKVCLLLHLWDSLLHVNTIYRSSGVTDWRQRGELPPWQAKCKNRSPTELAAFFWLSVCCCFHVFFGLFCGDLGFQFSHPHQDLPSFLSFFPSVG